MPKFIDTRPMGPITAEQLKQLPNAPTDKFGVTYTVNSSVAVSFGHLYLLCSRND